MYYHLRDPHDRHAYFGHTIYECAERELQTKKILV